ncbi:MAG: hypothetical protein AAF328_09690 [Planctomycetota bacterium]
MTPSRTLSLTVRGLAAFVISAGGLTLACPDAQAGQVSRSIRDTSSRTTSTSGKVLVAIPQNGNRYSYLRSADTRERNYFGRPVRCGLDANASLDNARLVVMRLPANRRYAAGYDLCESNRASGTVLQTVYGSDRRNPAASAPIQTAKASPADAMSNGFTVYAAGSTQRADLPEAVQHDGWALLNHGRFRDALSAFDEQVNLNVNDQAGQAIAMAMTGQLDSAADLFAAMRDVDSASAKVSPRLKSQLAAMADMMRAERPDAAAMLTAMAEHNAPDGA